MRVAFFIAAGLVALGAALGPPDTRAPIVTPALTVLCCAILGTMLLVAICLLSVDDQPPGPPPPPDRHPADHWTGRCYRCGDLVHPHQAVSYHHGSRPPRHFCRLCARSISLNPEETPRNRTDYDFGAGARP